ncbi:MAG: hypothetical protein AAF717_19760 [Bacteroidota bacterium]
MKKLILLSILMLITACSDNNDTNDPNLSFSIAPGNRFASSEITITNTSTDYSGEYRWEVSSEFETETYTTESISFFPRYATLYLISLQTADGDFETQQTLSIARPENLLFNSVQLKEIPQDYEELYFAVFESNAGTNRTRIYTSERMQNISADNPTQTNWSIQGSTAIIALTTIGSDIENLRSYEIEFYDGDDAFITRIDSFGNSKDEYVAGGVDLVTTTRDCAACASFVVTVDFGFGI